MVLGSQKKVDLLGCEIQKTKLQKGLSEGDCVILGKFF